MSKSKPEKQMQDDINKDIRKIMDKHGYAGALLLLVNEKDTEVEGEKMIESHISSVGVSKLGAHSLFKGYAEDLGKEISDDCLREILENIEPEGFNVH